MTNNDSYISLRKSLDSFNDVALAQFALFESDVEKKKFSDFVSNKVKELLAQIAKDNDVEWKKLNPAQAEKLAAHAARMSANDPKLSGCPPGFVEVDGMCVRINLLLT